MFYFNLLEVNPPIIANNPSIIGANGSPVFFIGIV